MTRHTLLAAVLAALVGMGTALGGPVIGPGDETDDYVDGAPLADPTPQYAAGEPQPRGPAVEPVVIVLDPTFVPADALIDSSPQQVGYVVELPEALVPADAWVRLPEGGWVARYEFLSAEAQGLRLRLLAPFSGGIEVRAYGPFDDQALGPYTFGLLGDDQTWWTPTIVGEGFGLEFYLPPMSIDEGLPPVPAVTAVAHLFEEDGCDCATGPGTALSCYNDVACSASWADSDARAVGQISFISGGGCFICTGALLNRDPSDNSLLFMTANHCISTRAEAATLEVRWLYQTDSCGGTLPGFNDVPRSNGAVLLKRRSSADWTLLGLVERPGGLFQLGWRSASWSSGESATGVHHPAGTRKRISFGTSDGSTSNATFCDQNGQNCFDADVWDIAYASGTTQGGSSGSPIFDPDRRVRGTLTGGPSGCAPITKRYGRLDLAYTNLRYFLFTDYIASPVIVNGGFGGDAGNNGSTERGTVINPFNEVREAIYAVRASDTVLIQPGNYNEQFLVTRPMALERLGSSGSVLIGQ